MYRAEYRRQESEIRKINGMLECWNKGIMGKTIKHPLSIPYRLYAGLQLLLYAEDLLRVLYEKLKN